VTLLTMFLLDKVARDNGRAPWQLTFGVAF